MHSDQVPEAEEAIDDKRWDRHARHEAGLQFAEEEAKEVA